MFCLVGCSNHDDSYWTKKTDQKNSCTSNGGLSHKIPSPHLPWDDLASQPFEGPNFGKPPIKPVVGVK